MFQLLLFSFSLYRRSFYVHCHRISSGGLVISLVWGGLLNPLLSLLIFLGLFSIILAVITVSVVGKIFRWLC